MADNFEGGGPAPRRSLHSRTLPGKPAGTGDLLYGLTVKQWAVTAVATGLALLVFSGWLWKTKIYQSPERTFWGMVDTMLDQQGVTRRATQSSQGSKTEELIHVSLSGGVTARGYTKVEVRDGNAFTIAETEVLHLPDADYIRYLSVQTNRKKPNGSSLDFSQVTGVWGKRQAEGGPVNSSLHQAMNGLVPVGNFAPIARRQLAGQIRQSGAYSPDMSKVRHRIVAGRRVLMYQVTVDMRRYAEVMQGVLAAQGMGKDEQLDPKNFPEGRKVVASVMIDPSTRQLVQVEVPGSGRIETYESYGVAQAVRPPKSSITEAELTERMLAVER